MQRKRRYLFFDDMELYQKVLCDLAKQGLVFEIGKKGCRVMKEQSPRPKRRQREEESP